MNTKNTVSNTAFETMTIGAALRTIKLIKGEVAEHGQRAVGSVMLATIEGVEPPVQIFDFAAERAARAEAQERLVRLQSAVAVTNARTMIVFEERRMPLAEAIRRFEELKGDLTWLEGLPINERTDRRERTEFVNNVPSVKEVRTVHKSHLPERERVSQVAALRKRVQALNLLIEATNHRVLVKVERLPEKETAPVA